MERELCFICCGPLASVVNGELNYTSRSRKTGAALLGNNLNVIFLLRKLLQVPGSQLETQLKECGDNPESWLSLCDQCIQLIKKGRELDQEIQRIEGKLRSIKKQVLEKIRAGGSGRGTDDKVVEDVVVGAGHFGNSCSFGMQIRSFVKNCELEYGESEDDILEGDQLANDLVEESPGNNRTAAIILVEKSVSESEDEQSTIKVEEKSSSPVSPICGDDSPKQFVENEDNPIYYGPGPVNTPAVYYSCTFCGSKFLLQTTLLRHVKLVHEKRSNLTCPLCGKGFKDRASLHRHLFQKHKDDPVTKKVKKDSGIFWRKCSVIGCPVHFTNQDDEDIHMERIHGGRDLKTDKMFKCKYCGNGFWCKWKCRRHEKIYERKGSCPKKKKIGGKPKEKVKSSRATKFKCEICSRAFGWAKNWSDHLWNEHDKRDISCPGKECGRIFNDNLVEFQEHWKTSHVAGKIKVKRIKSIVKRKKEKVKKDWPCSVCDRIFGSQAGALRHVRVVHEQRLPNVCPLCSRGFEDKRGLNCHLLRTHKDDPITRKLQEETGIFLRKCSVVGCVARFMKQEDEDRHMEKVHGGGGNQSNEKRYKCKYCGRGFWDWGKCRRHEKIHEVKGKVRNVCGNGVGRDCKGTGVGVGVKCDLCGITCKNARYWSDHLWKMHGKMDITCPGLECGKIFKDDIVEFQKHWKTSHMAVKRRELNNLKVKRVRGYRRRKPLSGVKLKTLNEGGMDGVKVSEDNRFNCEICPRSFKWARRWSTHLWNKHDKRDIICPELECGKNFDKLVEFQNHWKASHVIRKSSTQTYRDGEKYSCSICGKEFMNKQGLGAHLRIHMLDKQLSSSSSEKWAGKEFVCGICGNRFISQVGLYNHKRIIHKVGRKDLPIRPKRKKGERPTLGEKVLCNICGKEISSEGNLRTHVKFVHDKQFDLSCHVCGKAFVNSSQMKMHILGSHGEDPVAVQLREEEDLNMWRCPVAGCSKRYLRKEVLDKHVEMFHGDVDGGGGEKKEGRFKCKYCGKGFWEGFKLRRHERVHEGKGRDDFKCGICGKGFGTPDYLNYHRLFTHKQAKKFQTSGEKD